MIEFNNRDFKMWAYIVSHSFLILRSPLKFPDQDDFDESQSYNIDIEFTDVIYVDAPTDLERLQIEELGSEIPEKFQAYVKGSEYKVFELTSNARRYYIVAWNCTIGTNNWIAEDRISNMNLRHDQILASSS